MVDRLSVSWHTAVQKLDMAASGTGAVPRWVCWGLTPQHGFCPAFVSTVSWRHGGFTMSPSHVPEKQDRDEQKQQRMIPTELIQ